MSNDVKQFGSIERAVRALLVDWRPEYDGKIGRDFGFTLLDESDVYVRIDKVTSRTDRFEGDFTIDIEVFGQNYLATESHALDIERVLLGYPHVVEVEDHTWVFDTVSQNTGPDDLPWEDDEVSRLGATYVITARRR